MSFDVMVSMTTLTCYKAGCGIVFAVPSWWDIKRREDHTAFFCPNGHSQWFTAETEAEKLQKQLAREKHLREQETARLRNELHYERDRADGITKSLTATKGVVTRIKNRVGRGVCPCCNRTFANLGRHMKGEHPEWAPEAVEVSS